MSGNVVDEPWLVWDTDFDRLPVELIGGKAKGLGLLVTQRVPTPRGFCVTTAALRTLLRSGSVRPLGEDTREYLLKSSLPNPLENQVREATRTLASHSGKAVSFAVRSSFATEDSLRSMAPGIYDSFIGLTTEEQILQALRDVWVSAFAPEALRYRQRMGDTADNSYMAVVIQIALQAKTGGVLYSMLPDSQDPSCILLEYTAGSPSKVVGGTVVPSRQVIRKGTIAKAIDPDLLTTEQLALLMKWCSRLEHSARAPIDVEWLVSDQEELFALQLRSLSFTTPGLSPGPSVKPARYADLKSSKVTPFRLGLNPGVHSARAHVITPNAFVAYRNALGVLDRPVGDEVSELFASYCARGPVSVRAAYWSALRSGDMLPQSPPVRSVDECWHHLKSYWQYAIDNELDDYTAEVAALVSNWLNPRASVIATVSPDRGGERIMLASLYGFLEGLESCAHDVYEVITPRMEVTRRDVPSKPVAVLRPGSRPERVTEVMRDQPVLSEDEIKKVAKEAAALYGVLGAVRAEILVLSGDVPASAQVITWQASPLSAGVGTLYYYTCRKANSAQHTGTCGRLTIVRDAGEARSVADDPDRKIVFVDLEHTTGRDPITTKAIASLLSDARRPTLFRGSLLSHFAALLRESGVAVYPINSSDSLPPPGVWVEIVQT